MRTFWLAAASFLAVAAPAVAETVKVDLDAAMPNAPGKHMSVITVGYAPGEASKPHRHAGSGFLYARVLSGHIRSQVEGAGPARVYGPGEGWTEGPGAHHLVSANASTNEPATLLVVFVADAGDPLTVPDRP
ncbi:MAG TPA: cupin domain-containing protein [Caulobacteraceae bacterium]|jgi:quercetin dioxygenase-like cupin family protein|nr:cupin domain-containing protein [Caulobacteraceae bacterium]